MRAIRDIMFILVADGPYEAGRSGPQGAEMVESGGAGGGDGELERAGLEAVGLGHRVPNDVVALEGALVEAPDGAGGKSATDDLRGRHGSGEDGIGIVGGGAGDDFMGVGHAVAVGIGAPDLLDPFGVVDEGVAVVLVGGIDHFVAVAFPRVGRIHGVPEEEVGQDAHAVGVGGIVGEPQGGGVGLGTVVAGGHIEDAARDVAFGVRRSWSPCWSAAPRWWRGRGRRDRRGRFR